MTPDEATIEYLKEKNQSYKDTIFLVSCKMAEFKIGLMAVRDSSETVLISKLDELLEEMYRTLCDCLNVCPRMFLQLITENQTEVKNEITN